MKVYSLKLSKPQIDMLETSLEELMQTPGFLDNKDMLIAEVLLDSIKNNIEEIKWNYNHH